MNKIIPFCDLPDYLNEDAAAVLDRETNLIFLSTTYQMLVRGVFKEFTAGVLAFLCRDVILQQDGEGAWFPLIEHSNWLDEYSLFGTDFSLTPPLPASIPSLAELDKALHDACRSMEVQTLCFPTLGVENEEGYPAAELKVHGFDLTKDFSSLNSKHRNELKKAHVANEDTWVHEPDGSEWVARAIELTILAWRTKMQARLLLNWVWLYACAQTGRGCVISVHSTADNRVLAYAGFVSLSEDTCQFLSFVKTEPRPYIGSFTLAKGIETLKTRMSSKVRLLLTCPLPDVGGVQDDRLYEVYKYHLSNFTWQCPNPYYCKAGNSKPWPPYFELTSGKWVTDENKDNTVQTGDELPGGLQQPNA